MSAVIPPLPAFTKYFEGPLRALTQGASYTDTYNFGIAPKGYAIVYECIAAGDGFALGEIATYEMTRANLPEVQAELRANDALVRVQNSGVSTSGYLNNTTGAQQSSTVRFSFRVRYWA